MVTRWGGYNEMVHALQGDLGPIPTIVCYRDYLLILIKWWSITKNVMWWLWYISFLKELLIDRWVWSDISLIQGCTTENRAAISQTHQTPFSTCTSYVFLLPRSHPKGLVLVNSEENKTLCWTWLFHHDPALLSRCGWCPSLMWYSMKYTTPSEVSLPKTIYTESDPTCPCLLVYNINISVLRRPHSFGTLGLPTHSPLGLLIIPTDLNAGRSPSTWNTSLSTLLSARAATSPSILSTWTITRLNWGVLWGENACWISKT